MPNQKQVRFGSNALVLRDKGQKVLHYQIKSTKNLQSFENYNAKQIIMPSKQRNKKKIVVTGDAMLNGISKKVLGKSLKVTVETFLME